MVYSKYVLNNIDEENRLAIAKEKSRKVAEERIRKFELLRLNIVRYNKLLKEFAEFPESLPAIQLKLDKSLKELEDVSNDSGTIINW